MPRIAFLVSGDVQGVGFRYFTREQASAAGLAGWVRNRFDGKVEGEAEGSEVALAAFVDQLRRGPVTASVDSVGTHPVPETGSVGGFRIER